LEKPIVVHANMNNVTPFQILEKEVAKARKKRKEIEEWLRIEEETLVKKKKQKIEPIEPKGSFPKDTSGVSTKCCPIEPVLHSSETRTYPKYFSPIHVSSSSSILSSLWQKYCLQQKKALGGPLTAYGAPLTNFTEPRYVSESASYEAEAGSLSSDATSTESDEEDELSSEAANKHQSGAPGYWSLRESEKPFKCPHSGCSKSFSQKRNLKQHIKYHFDREFKCNVDGCDKAFVRRSDLKKHLSVHTIDRPYVCSFPGCDKRFKQKGNLKKHTEVHSAARPYICTYPSCGKAFKAKATLKTHLRIHSSVRPFVCQVPGCGKAFKRNYCLKSHMRYIHSEERPFKCAHPGCDKAFKESGGLKKHELVHSNIPPYRCSSCNASFSLKDSFTCHVKYVHSSPKPSKCTYLDSDSTEYFIHKQSKDTNIQQNIPASHPSVQYWDPKLEM